jgi:MoxR-like ATPase
MIYKQQSGEFVPRKGPVFTNILLADEINRAPAKVQSALLEAMAEEQVTIGEQTYRLPKPFFVMATQNPIEQEGTYSLPEAQLDRFMLKVIITYPTLQEEHLVLKRMGVSAPDLSVSPVISGQEILDIRKTVDSIYTTEDIEKYVLHIVDATRNPENHSLESLKPFISHGASPRASICLIKTAKAHALLKGRDFVLPQDVKEMAPDVLRHRVALTYKAEAEEKDIEYILKKILDTVEVPAAETPL